MKSHMIEIVQKEHKVLRTIAKKVPLGEITSSYIQKVLSDMKAALDSQFDGVAIAAPQIGESLRIFVVSPKAFLRTKHKRATHAVFINPAITKLSKDKEIMEEGCLSVRYLYGKIERRKKASIEAYDEGGKFFSMGASGLLAQIFQHETDHLDGKLFIDQAIEIKELPAEEIAKIEKFAHES